MDAFGPLELSAVNPHRPVLIAGPTASGKSGLALAIAEAQGGVIVNADASQIYDCWQVVTARPGDADLARAQHLLYGHVAYDAPYSAGHWLREVAPLLSNGKRPIIVGGTGLYFTALTNGLAEIPATPDELRKSADSIPLEKLLAALDPETTARIDVNNRARVQRAWEVLHATGRGLAAWHNDTPPPLLPDGSATCIALASPPDWLNARIAQRFDMMLKGGALDEIAAMRDRYDPVLPSCRAIGVPELMAHACGKITLEAARDAAVIATRQYAKRQRTWQRSKMAHWQWVDPSTG
ncbi:MULTISPECIES: tRNA (adenosine(37)-N6)-dimethylallyltransferase MiaA [Roseobacteraceae]|jgi:tRNA dimethylallyltransferase|uniref:tRNA dimethylallyltransferase n=1 Tax=Pseudosulfitobacter pseudonitzschiae TaxID=1402135 RepID=A0A221K0K6_9RHOB|nr:MULTISPECIES: tRNA (adenosine(37)-N6)-dimethylallyltransferase MiaA [Roseobacteraceae]ASM72524.1 tRNA dimethylallyltransferase [Pseudosulfitobacter pseudonitzschiae]